MISKQFRSIVVAQIFSALAVTICLLIDGMLTSKFLGEDSMAAFGMAGALIFLFAATGGTIASGAQIISSKALGMGDADEANASFSTAVVVGFIISIISVVIVVMFAKPIALVLGAVEGSQAQVLTSDYLIGYMIGCPAFVLMQTLNPFLQLSGKKKVVLMAVALMIVIDIAADLLNVFVFHAGTFGMGIASSLSYYASFIVAVSLFVTKRTAFSFSIRKFSMRILKGIVGLGATYAVYQVCRALFRMTINNILMASGGKTFVATYSVVNTIYEIFLSAGMGIAATVLMMAGVYYGEGNRDGLDQLIKMFLKTIVKINGGIILLVLLFAGPIVSLFSSDPSLKEACTLGLRIMIVAILPFSVSASMRSFYQGIQRTAISQVVCIMQNYVLSVVCVLFFKAVLGSEIFLWTGVVCGELMAVLFIIVLSMIINKRPFTGMRDLNIADSSVKSTKPKAEYVVYDQNEATNVAKELQEVCKELGVSGTDTMAIAMCVEELGTNTFKHGKQKKDGKNKTAIEVRLMEAGDGLSITMTDNSNLFDPVGYFEQHKDEKDDKHIGISNVRKLAKELNYINMFGLNCVTIKI